MSRAGPALAILRCGHVRSQNVTSLSCLTFLTDFGLEDGFVAACHGVAARIAPAARVIDITHLVPPGDVRRGATRAVLLTNQKLWNHPVPPTFHGRDIFMPVASHLATGTSMTEAGTEVDLSELVMLAKPTSRMLDREAEGEVLSVDRFGNVQLSIPSATAADLGIEIGSSVIIRCNRRELTAPYLETFGSAAPGGRI